MQNPEPTLRMANRTALRRVLLILSFPLLITGTIIYRIYQENRSLSYLIGRDMAGNIRTMREVWTGKLESDRL